MLISIVIPVHNSTVLQELANRIDKIFVELPGKDYELIFVDDGSSNPEVWLTLERLTRQRHPILALQLTRNFGQHAATLCGLKEARGDFIVTMDDDLQHRPEDLPKLLALTDWDIVVGQFDKKSHAFFKRLLSRAKGIVDWIAIGKPRDLQLTSYRLLSRTVVDGMLSIHTVHPFLPALMFHVSKNVIGVNVNHDPRSQGKSGYSLYKLLSLFSNLFLNNSSLLLRCVGQVGLLCAGMSLLGACIVVYRKLTYGIAVQGWASLFVSQLLIGGLLLFSFGVVGEYLIRILENSEMRPIYFVRRRRGEGGSKDEGHESPDERSFSNL